LERKKARIVAKGFS